MTSSHRASSRGPLNPAAVRRSMCLVLIIRMQSAVRLSLVRIDSFRRSFSWASSDMTAKGRPKRSPSQHGVNRRHGRGGGRQAKMLYSGPVQRGPPGPAACLSSVSAMSVRKTISVIGLLAVGVIAGGVARAQEPPLPPATAGSLPPPPSPSPGPEVQPAPEPQAPQPSQPPGPPAMQAAPPAGAPDQGAPAQDYPIPPNVQGAPIPVQ